MSALTRSEILNASRATDGARVSFEQMYRDHAALVSRWAAALLGSEARSEVEDVVHDVFVVVQRRLSSYRGESKLTTWLYGITIKVVADRRRRWRRKQKLFGWMRRDRSSGAGGEVDGLRDNQEDLLGRRQQLAQLQRLIDGMDEKYRTVLVLYEIEEMDGPAIAELMGTSLESVWQRLSRARRLLSAQWQQGQRGDRR